MCQHNPSQSFCWKLSVAHFYTRWLMCMTNSMASVTTLIQSKRRKWKGKIVCVKFDTAFRLIRLHSRLYTFQAQKLSHDRTWYLVRVSFIEVPIFRVSRFFLFTYSFNGWIAAKKYCVPRACNALNVNCCRLHTITRKRNKERVRGRKREANSFRLQRNKVHSQKGTWWIIKLIK